MSLRTAKLGSNGPELSVVGFGAWEAGMAADWGTPPPEDQVVRAIATVLETGINWIDTAEVYGDGTSERLVARALRGRRDEVLMRRRSRLARRERAFEPSRSAEPARRV